MALCLTESDIRAVLSMSDLIGAMETALAAFSSGEVEQPVRGVLEMGTDAFFAAMPGFIRTPPALGAKLVSVVGANQKRGLPTHRATILLLDPQTGALLAIMDGRLITEMRTAAVSAVSVKYLARQDADVLAILGSGVQARSHLEALPLVRSFRKVKAWSPTPDHLRNFAPDFACASAADAVASAGVVVLATASSSPVIDAAWVSEGVHIVSVGACRPYQREIDPALLARARVVVDSRAAALQESGDIILGNATIAAELGEVVAGRAAGRTSQTEITVFKSLGLAVEDVAAAHLAYQRARCRNLGVEVEI